jgi:DNA-binding MarR family transcriptional regulator
MRLPLPTLLSQTLVALTIELDNEFEQRMVHRTTRGSASASQKGPWLVSLVMWSNLLRLVGADGALAGDLERSGGNLAGMQRWGYVTVAGDPGGARRTQAGRDRLVSATAHGRAAAEVWPPLAAAIEERWRQRFGSAAIAEQRDALAAILRRLELELPAYLPVLGYGLRSRLPSFGVTPARSLAEADAADLTSLLSGVLLAFTLDYESDAQVSLPIRANVTRVLDADPLALREIPRRSGVAKEAIAMALGVLVKRGEVELDADPSARGRRARLTPRGVGAKQCYERLLGATERRWQERFGADAVGVLRRSLEPLVGEATAERSPLFEGLDPQPGSWRAAIARPQTLPHHPMVLHRGGRPDGS